MDTSSIIAKLQAIIADLGGSGTLETPPGFVAIRPTGAQGVGRVRFWPAGNANLADPRNGEMVLAYADRCSRIVDPATGHPFWQHGRWPELPGFNPYETASGMSEMLDRLQYSRDWMTQEQLDTAVALAARDAAENNRFSPG